MFQSNSSFCLINFFLGMLNKDLVIRRIYLDLRKKKSICKWTNFTCFMIEYSASIVLNLHINAKKSSTWSFFPSIALVLRIRAPNCSYRRTYEELTQQSVIFNLN